MVVLLLQRTMLLFLLLEDSVVVLFLLETLSFVDKGENYEKQGEAHIEGPHGNHFHCCRFVFVLLLIILELHGDDVVVFFFVRIFHGVTCVEFAMI
jgi:hypothetical protein